MAERKEQVWNPKVRTFFSDGEDEVENRMIPINHPYYRLRAMNISEEFRDLKLQKRGK